MQCPLRWFTAGQSACSYGYVILAPELDEDRDWGVFRWCWLQDAGQSSGLRTIIGRTVWRNPAAKSTNVVVVICFPDLSSPVSPSSLRPRVFMSISHLIYKAEDAALPSKSNPSLCLHVAYRRTHNTSLSGSSASHRRNRPIPHHGTPPHHERHDERTSTPLP
jgi:hypothetical protein